MRIPVDYTEFRNGKRSALVGVVRQGLCCLLVAFAPALAVAQSCPAVNFLTAVGVNSTPATGSHLSLVRQSDGSYTAFQMSDTSPYGVTGTTPGYGKQLRQCLPASSKNTGSVPSPPQANANGATSQPVASAVLPSGNYVLATSIGAIAQAIDVSVFDSSLRLISEKTYNTPDLSFSFADMNGDGKLDLVSLHESSIQLEPNAPPPSISVLLGNGDGTFRPAVTTPLNSPFAPQSFALGDLNGDGKLDLAYATQGFGGGGAQIGVLLGNGDGTFGKERDITGFVPYSIAIADLNGDGKLDLAYVATGTESSDYYAGVAFGAGDGTFKAFQQFPIAQSAGIAIGDVNGDGIPDIVTDGVSVLYGNGTGGFPVRQDYLAAGNSGYPMLLDLDADGIQDIVLASGSPVFLLATSSVLFGRGGGTFLAAPAVLPFPSSNGESTAFTLGDFNGDGLPDLAALGETSVVLLTGNGDGTFHTGYQYTFENMLPGGFALAGDFNRDGQIDLLVPAIAPNSTGDIIPGFLAFFAGHGDGTFSDPVISDTPAFESPLVAADFNGDGVLDLASAPGVNPEAVLVFMGRGDGTFLAPVSYPSGAGTRYLATGDFNGDGKPDLAVASAAGVGVLLNKGDGTFATERSTQLSATNFASAQFVAADFNRDGKLDLAVTFSNESDGTSAYTILLGKGDGTFSETPVIPAVASGTSLVTGDFNGDGIPDLVASPGFLAGKGDGTFQPAQQISPLPIGPIFAADFNGDGKLDVAAAGSPGLAIFLNSPRPSSPSTRPMTVVNSATFEPGPLVPGSLASAFGTHLATGTESASGASMPTVLAGTTVTIEDSTGASLSAPLLFVSPNQVNFSVPVGLVPGLVTVTVTAADGIMSGAQAQLVEAAPALFTVNSAGLAAADVVYVASNGSESTAVVFTSQNGSIVPVPIALSSAAGQVYLSLYCTGLGESVPGLNPVVTVSIGGVNATVSYAGTQGTFPGLQQINVLLPPSLAGKGSVPIVATAGGAASNTAYVTIQ